MIENFQQKEHARDMEDTEERLKHNVERNPEKMRILFIDDRLNEVSQQWQSSGCGNKHELLPLKEFQSIEETLEDVRIHKPDVVVIGFGLGKQNVNGADVIRGIHEGDIDVPFVVANSGGGEGLFSQTGIQVNKSADRSPVGLEDAIDAISRDWERDIKNKRDVFPDWESGDVRQVREFIREGKVDRAINFIESTWMNYEDAEKIVVAAFDEEKVSPEILNAALEKFLETRSDYKHGLWVHSLSHFTESLWRHGFRDWIRLFNKTAFDGANRLDEPNCCDRLVDDFAKFSAIEDHPHDFYITPENIDGWIDWEFLEFARIRVEVGKFDSEEEFLLWTLQHTEAQEEWDDEAQASLINLKKVEETINRLQEIGAVLPARPEKIKEDLLEQKLADLRHEQGEEEAIEITRSQIASL